MLAGAGAAICIDCDADAPMIMPMEGSSGASVSPIDPRCGIPTAEAIKAAARNDIRTDNDPVGKALVLELEATVAAFDPEG